MSGKIDRRGFLKGSLMGVCGAALVPGISATAPARAGRDGGAAIPALPGRMLGRTGITAPLISMGTAAAASVNLIRAGYDAGVKLFFSATYYGHGNNERLVGEALKGLPRDSFIVGTAATPDGFNPQTGAMPKDLTASSYMKTAEDSLKRFGLDHVDILLLPFAGKRESVMSGAILEAMTALKKQGKIRFAGIATHDTSAEALQAAADARIYDVAQVAYNFKVRDKDRLHEAMAYAAKAGVGLVAMKTAAGVAQDKNGAQPLNVPAALKWVLQNQNIATIVAGMSSVEEMKKDLEMIRDLKMSEQEMRDLNLGDPKKEPGLYCQQCRACEPQCPHGLDIPTLMRSYMYAYGYRSAAQARAALDTVDVSGRPCDRCDACRVVCASGFDVRDRIQDILRLKDVPREFL